MTEAPPSPNQKRILLVDDEEDLRDILKDLLTRKGMAVEVAQGFETAMLAIEQRDFDLVISDYLMKGPTGLDLFKRMSKSIPLILLTGCSDICSRDASGSGVHAILEKPVDFKHLLNCVSEALGGSRAK